MIDVLTVFVAFLLGAVLLVTAARASQREEHLRDEIRRWERYREAMERGRD